MKKFSLIVVLSCWATLGSALHGPYACLGENLGKTFDSLEGYSMILKNFKIIDGVLEHTSEMYVRGANNGTIKVTKELSKMTQSADEIESLFKNFINDQGSLALCYFLEKDGREKISFVE